MAQVLHILSVKRVLLVCITLFVILSTIVNCLYEDEVGKFDWRKQFTGIPKYLYSHPNSDNIIIGTRSNVITSILNKDGSILWRQLLPNGCQLNHMSILRSSEDYDDHLVKTMCSDGINNQTIVWEPKSGLLASDKRYKYLVEDDRAESVMAEPGKIVDDSRVFMISEDFDLIVSKDGLISMRGRDQIKWSREESLASVVDVKIVKLPIDMRDKFGFKKMIVLLTQAGKLFGMDTVTGDVVWSLFDQELSETSLSNPRLILSKESDDSSSDSRVFVVHPHGYILSFNPITGELIHKKNLQSSIKQIAMTATDEEDQSRGIILLDTEDKVHIYPDSFIEQTKSDINKYYMTIAEREPHCLYGYRFTIKSDTIVPEIVWSFPFNETEQIINLSVKRIDEDVHSPARVLGDRGILYKYVNPNLIAIMTEGNYGDTSNPDNSINIYLIDGVTGALVHSIYQHKARSPSKMVHSENWLVYSYYSTKTRRTEISSLEMFEGITQVNSTAFSSLTRSHIKPRLIEHKSFIFPNGIETMAETITLRGMTNKHLIVALPSGALLEIPRIFLDPRRPINILMEHREEGLIPYMPELPIPSESMINYHQTLMAIRKIETSPAELESTSLVFAYGLDFFFTRVTPSKHFDILKDDFDHVLISFVLAFLVVASFATKYLAQRKALHAAWK